MLTVPNTYLQRGSTFVGYSGGKCLRGPQCSGVVLAARICSRRHGYRVRRTTATAAP